MAILIHSGRKKLSIALHPIPTQLSTPKEFDKHNNNWLIQTRTQNLTHSFTSLYHQPTNTNTNTNQQSKNTCAHNNTHKAHANGIQKKKRTKYVSTKGVEPKFVRNQRFSKKYNKGGRKAVE